MDGVSSSGEPGTDWVISPSCDQILYWFLEDLVQMTKIGLFGVALFVWLFYG